MPPDVYVLASPSPTLYVYPAARHPVTTRGGTYRRTPHLPALPKPLRLHGRGLLMYRVDMRGTARLVHASARLDYAVQTSVRVPSWQHLRLSLAVLDVLLEDWDA